MGILVFGFIFVFLLLFMQARRTQKKDLEVRQPWTHSGKGKRFGKISKQELDELLDRDDDGYI